MGGARAKTLVLAMVAAAVLSVGSLAAPGQGNAATSAVPVAAAAAGPGGATELTLAPGLSFTDDSSSAFPIRGKNLEDGKIASDRPTAIFFGTSHCYR